MLKRGWWRGQFGFVGSEFTVDGAGGDAEQAGGEVFVSAGIAQCLVDNAALNFLHGCSYGDDNLAGIAFGAFAYVFGQIRQLDEGISAQDDGALHGMLQLAHVAGPGVVFECFQGFGCQSLQGFVVFEAEVFEEVLCQEGNVLAS